jgi:flagellar basal body P-ring protein FlgI
VPEASPVQALPVTETFATSSFRLRVVCALSFAVVVVVVGAGCAAGSPADDAGPEPMERAFEPARGTPPIRTAASFRFEADEFVTATTVSRPMLEGTGVVIGLPATGDVVYSGTALGDRLRSRFAALQATGLIPESIDVGALEEGRLALVKVRAPYPADRSAGARLDLVVELLGNAMSLRRGRFAAIELTDPLGGDVRVARAVTTPILEATPIENPIGPDGRVDPELRQFRVPNSAFLTRELPADRVDREVIDLSLRPLSRDIADGLRREIRRRYPFDVQYTGGGERATRLRIRISPGFDGSTADVVATVRNLTFPVEPRHNPLIVFDNRRAEIVLVGGAIPLKRRWMTVARLPESPFATAAADGAEADADPAADPAPDARGTFVDPAGRREGEMAQVLYMLASEHEAFGDLRDVEMVEDDEGVRVAGIQRMGRISPGDAVRAYIVAPGGDALAYTLPRNALAPILQFLRDELGLPPAELKSFCIEAVANGYIDAFVHERQARQVLSDDQTVTWFVDLKRLAFGNILLAARPVDLPGNRWDVRPTGEAFDVADLRDLGPSFMLLDGRTFEWRDADGELQQRTIELSSGTRRAYLEQRVDYIVRTAPTVQTAVEELRRERNLVEWRDEDGPEDPYTRRIAELLVDAPADADSLVD